MKISYLDMYAIDAERAVSVRTALLLYEKIITFLCRRNYNIAHTIHNIKGPAKIEKDRFGGYKKLWFISGIQIAKVKR